MRLRRVDLEDIAFGVLTLALLIPLWSVRYPPFQDFPQYVALTRTLRDYTTPGLGFERIFELNFQTYALFPPWLGAALGLVFDPLVATKLLVSSVIVATPWGVRRLLRALGRPAVYAAFLLPLAYNAHVVMGFVGYVVGVALMIWGLVFGLSALEKEHLGWRIALGLVALACLYSHVVPFAFMVGGLGIAALLTGSLRSCQRLVVPLLPALALFALGLTRPSTGWSTLPLGMTGTTPNCPIYDPTRVTFAELPDWINDVFISQWDERLLLGLVLAAAVVVAVGAHFGPIPERGKQRRIALGVAMLAPLGLALYFVMPRTCDWIWPIHARFLFIGAMLAVTLLPALPRLALHGLGLALAITTIAVTVRTTHEFRIAEREVGDMEQAFQAIPQGKLVAALTFDKQASPMRRAGFHHFGAYCQAERGGLTMFSFASMHHWPIRIRPELHIPEPSYNYQFNPHAVSAGELDWAEYVLTRGMPPPAVVRKFSPVYSGLIWHVYRKTSP